MELLLKRQIKTVDFTLGELFIDGVHFCYTVEDMERMNGEKVFGKTAIPQGTYKVELSMSHHFGKVLPEILDVKNFSGVRIHSGNSASDSEGCVILGMNRTINGVSMSRVAMQKLMERFVGKTETINLTII